jgi:hypothetical protein
MPRDGDPMSENPQQSSAASPARPLLRPGRKAILVSSDDGEGRNLYFAFAQTRDGIEFWRSLDAGCEPLTRVEIFPGRLGPRAVADLLASGKAGPAIDDCSVDGVEVDGADGRWGSLIALAWSRVEGRLPPRVAGLLTLGDAQLDLVEEASGSLDASDLLEFADYLVMHGAEWLQKWRTAIETEVERRAALEGGNTGDPRRAKLRAFVEECVLLLGRLPRPGESESAWDGPRFREHPSSERWRRRLGVLQSGRSGKHFVQVRFRSCADAFGGGHSSAGPGWFWDVLNPDPGWLNNDEMGPYDSDQDAWSDVRCLRDGE